MIKKSRLYTKTGDKGQTSLYGGKRIAKTHQRIAAIGTVDELNASLGVVSALSSNKKIERFLEKIQSDLFHLGAYLANSKSNLRLTNSDVDFLETTIDQLDERLPSLKNFILPAGDLAASFAHLSRSICRRAERELIKLAKHNKTDPIALEYLNRLSDLLFVIARSLAQQDKVKEKIWKQE